MFNMGTGEMILIAVLTLLVIPPHKLPQVATSLGRFLGQLQRGFAEAKKSLEVGLKEDPPKPNSSLNTPSPHDKT